MSTVLFIEVPDTIPDRDQRIGAIINAATRANSRITVTDSRHAALNLPLAVASGTG